MEEESPPQKTNSSTTPLASSTLVVKGQPSMLRKTTAKANMSIPDINTVTVAKLKALRMWARWSYRMRKYSGTLRRPFV